MELITSRHNSLVGRYRDAAQGHADLLLLDGLHLVSEALTAGIRLRQVIVSADALASDEVHAIVARLTAAGDIDMVSASARIMDAVSPVRSPSAIVALAERPTHDEARIYASPSPLVVIAVDVQDPGNVGAIVRVAEAAGATGAIVTGQSADPFGWKALRGSMGSALRLPIVVQDRADGAVVQARDRRCRIVATLPRGGRPLFDTPLTGPIALLIGGEGQGLSRALIDMADERVTIPMHAPVESLNAAVTTALLLFEAGRQRRG